MRVMGTRATVPAVLGDAATVLFGTTRRRILGWLLGHPDESFYLRQVVRNSGAALGAAQRELEQLRGPDFCSEPFRAGRSIFRLIVRRRSSRNFKACSPRRQDYQLEEAMNVSDWERNGWVTKHQTSRNEVRDLLQVVERDIADRAVEGLSADWRMNIAYNAGLRAAKSALTATGSPRVLAEVNNA